MSGIDISHIKAFVVQPALAAIELGGLAAVNQVTGTALAETNAEYLRQLGRGPAVSLWQLEPITAQDIYYRWLHLPDQVRLLVLVQQLLPRVIDLEEQLITDLRFGAIMCRLKYRMSPRALPAADDAAGMAALHKDVYNSAYGAADPLRNTPLFRLAIAASDVA